MIGGWEIDTGRRGGGFWVVGLLMDLSLFFLLSSIAPLTVELDGLVLPSLEGGGDRVHRVDALFDSLDEALFKHLAESDVVVAAEPRVLFEVLNVLLSGVGGHSDILEFGSSCGSGIRVAEASLELVDEVEE